jgi:hypothetical protein
MSKPTHKRTTSGRQIADAEVQRLADEAERGYDVDALVARREKGGPDRQPERLSVNPAAAGRSLRRGCR